MTFFGKKDTHTAQLPLSAYTKENAFKLFMFDVGILGAMSNLAPKTILDSDYEHIKVILQKTSAPRNS